MLCSFSSCAGPIPDNCSNCGDPMLPALRITSRRAVTSILPRSVHTSKPEHRSLPSACFATDNRATCAEVQSVKFGRSWQVGRRNALAAFQRQPFFWLTSK